MYRSPYQLLRRTQRLNVNTSNKMADDGDTGSSAAFSHWTTECSVHQQSETRHREGKTGLSRHNKNNVEQTDIETRFVSI